MDDTRNPEEAQGDGLLDIALAYHRREWSIIPIAVGTIAFLELENLDPSSGDLWYHCQTTRQGFLTLEAVFVGQPDTTQMTLFDGHFTELTSSTVVDGNPRIDRQVGAGETYCFRLSGANTDVNLPLVNLVHHVGSEVTVHGTDGEDRFEFDPTASRLVTINGVRYHFTHAEATTANSGGGTDTAYLHDSPGNDRFDAWAGMAPLYGGGFYNRALDFEQGQAIAQRHDDYDQANAHEATVWEAVGDWEGGNMTPLPLSAEAGGDASTIEALSAVLWKIYPPERSTSDGSEEHPTDATAVDWLLMER